MCQMSAVIQIHAHNGITGIQHCKLHCQISLCTGMRLYICVITAKELFCTLNSKVLYNIYTLCLLYTSDAADD